MSQLAVKLAQADDATRSLIHAFLRTPEFRELLRESKIAVGDQLANCAIGPDSASQLSLLRLQQEWSFYNELLNESATAARSE